MREPAPRRRSTLRRFRSRLLDLAFRSPDFGGEPFWGREEAWGAAPSVDIVEKDNAFEVTAELPGLDETDVEVKLVDGSLTIKGEKQEEKRKNYYLHERQYGSFERCFAVPEGVDADKSAYGDAAQEARSAEA